MVAYFYEHFTTKPIEGGDRKTGRWGDKEIGG
jgi:hypothetical protein